MGRLIIGITGSIGSGKSSCARYLGRRGFSVINVDKLYRHLYARGSPLRKKLIAAFGKSILMGNGTINRPIIRKIVFNHPKKLKLLNSIAHPILFEETKKRIARSKKPIIIDAPLLIEAGFDSLCDYVIVVHAKREIVLKRLLATRSLTRKEILKIMSTQMPFSKKRKHADFTVDTSGGYGRTHAQLRAVLRKIRNSRE